MNNGSFGSSALKLILTSSILTLASAACTVRTTGTGPAPSATDGGKPADGDEKDSDPKPSTGSKPDGATPDAGTDPTSTASTCKQIFACALECEDVPCEDACYASGSSEGKAQVDALIACSQANACEDGECIIANCSAEYDACE